MCLSVLPVCTPSFHGGFCQVTGRKRRRLCYFISIVVVIIWCHWMVLSFYWVRPLRKFRLDHYLGCIILFQCLSGLFKMLLTCFSFYTLRFELIVWHLVLLSSMLFSAEKRKLYSFLQNSIIFEYLYKAESPKDTVNKTT